MSVNVTRRRLVAASSLLLTDAALGGCARSGVGRTPIGPGGEQAGGAPTSNDTAAASPPKRRIVVCLDGTLATPQASTNIAWIATGCEGTGARPVPQHVSYLEGVGTRRGERFSGGAFGYGLSRQLLDAYRFIRGTWRSSEDEIFIFGLSRGAFAARSLANLIGLVGCLDTDSPELLDEAYRGWYRHARSSHPAARARAERAAAVVRPHVRPAKIAFLGVFDTVGTLGTAALFPEAGWDDAFMGVLRGEGRLEERLHDTGLGGHVERAYHALAIDEDLTHFTPDIWADAPDNPRQQQVWFAGGHGDAGGRHPDTRGHAKSLAKVPLVWMMEKAREAGLALERESWERLQAEADPLEPQHDAPPGVVPRFSGTLRRLGHTGPRSIPANAVIDRAVRTRLGQLVEIRDAEGNRMREQPYQPLNLPRAVG